MPTTPPLRSRGALVVAGLLLGASLTACADAELEVGAASVTDSGENATTSDGDATTEATTPSVAVSPSAGSGVAADDPDLSPAAVTVGAWSLRLPAGWSTLEGMEAASGATGALTWSTVDSQGKDQATWVSDLMAGTTDVVAEREGLAEQQAVTLADGRQLFHLVQNYSDNRAHIFGIVDGATLHLLRFGLDGTPEAAAVAAKSVSTATQMASGAPVAPTTPAPTTPAPATTDPAASQATSVV